MSTYGSLIQRVRLWSLRAPTPEGLQAILNRGQRVGELARAQVPGGVLIDLPHYESYYGIEINANTSRRRPLEMDPEVVFTLPIGPAPPHLGAAILWSPDHAGSGSSVGALLRLIVEIDRD
jgi:hypothetical protein